MKKLIYSILFIFGFCHAVTAQEIVKWKLDDLKVAIRDADKPTIINFWATICKPCIEEIPYFQEMVKKYDSAGVKLILVSLDMKESYPARIKSFASKRKFTAPIKFLDESNADLFCPAVDANWSGAIPASLFINNKTGYRKFFEEQLTVEKLEAEIKAML
jgi:thiol-disulfide isomerase/thioredoxin